MQKAIRFQNSNVRLFGSVSRAGPLKNMTLKDHDREVFDLIEQEKFRQFRGIELIASENFAYKYVFEALGTPLGNKAGLNGENQFGGHENLLAIEKLCQERTLAAYRCDPKKWNVNVHPHSGSPANFGLYTGLLNPGDKIMGLDLTQGGHLTHGF